MKFTQGQIMEAVLYAATDDWQPLEKITERVAERLEVEVDEQLRVLVAFYCGIFNAIIECEPYYVPTPDGSGDSLYACHFCRRKGGTREEE